MRIVGSPEQWWRTWERLLLPVACPGCGVPDHVVCPTCRAAVLRGPLRSRPLADGTVAWASAPWRGPARGLIVAAKEAGRHDVTEVLARGVARGVAQVGWQSCRATPRLLLVPAPHRLGAVIRRADRPAFRLAARTAALLRAAGADVAAADLLCHTRRVRDQAGLSRDERAENLVGAIRVKALRRAAVGHGCDVVVVDDVLTTGATVLASCAALRRAGFGVLGASVVASA